MIIQAPVAIDSVASIRWKNGGGTTRQLAVSPVDATADDFLWRISIAQIDVPGEFSAFPGIDRTILLWRGEGVTLTSSAWPDRQLNDPRLPFNFRGEEEVVCDLIGGPVQDLNLMVRRGLVDATFDVINKGQYAVPACDDFILLCASGSAQFAAQGNDQALGIKANCFLRVSNVIQNEAIVVMHDHALLIAIAIRVLE
jgi:environmental stress-induced protein Ves